MIGKRWSKEDVEILINMANNGKSLKDISVKLCRTENSVTNKWVSEGLHKIYPGFKYNGEKKVFPNKKDYRTAQFRYYPKNRNYLVSDTAVIWSIRAGKELSQYKRRTGRNSKKFDLYVKIEKKDVPVKKIVAQTWLNYDSKKGKSIIHRDGNLLNNDISNLVFLDKKAAGRLTGGMTNNRHEVVRLVNGKAVLKYPSVRSCAKKEGYSYQTIYDYLKGNVKNPKIHVMYYKDYVSLLKKRRAANA